MSMYIYMDMYMSINFVINYIQIEKHFGRGYGYTQVIYICEFFLICISSLMNIRIYMNVYLCVYYVYVYVYKFCNELNTNRKTFCQKNWVYTGNICILTCMCIS
jgi:hypothetical protein